jgi:hypothetical protein
VRGQLGLGAGAEDLAAAQDQQAIAGLADLGQHVVRGQEHGVLVLELVDELAHLDDLPRVEAAGRLVEDDQRRPVDDGLGDADPLAVAVGQRADGLAGDADQIGQRERRADLLLALAGVDPRRSHAKSMYSATGISM